MDKINSKSLRSNASDSEGSNDYIEEMVDMNDAHKKLVSISQDTSSIASQEYSINYNSVSIMTTAENKGIKNEDCSVLKSGPLLPVEVAARLLHSEQLV
ncbi:hypothetical protein BGZ49_002556, partial [Haplosporangium sp. Z 27]